MKEQENINPRPNGDASFETWIAKLFGETLDDIRDHLADEPDEDRKRAMYLVFLSAFTSGRAATPVCEPSLVEKMWPGIAETLGMNPDLNHYRSKAERPSARRWVILKVAAVVIPVVLFVGGFLWKDISSQSGLAPAEFVATASVVARGDSIRHVTLSDGTKVTLNRNSILLYNDNRECRLSGEAFFRVAKDPGHPFVIHSDELTVKVLGTEFNFDANANTSVLSLYAGVVELAYKQGTQLIDSAGKEFSLDHETDTVETRDFDTELKPGWIVAEEMVMNLLPLGEIFDIIEARYGVTITGRGAVDVSETYNFIPDPSASVEDSMRALQFASGEFDYRKDGTTITLE